MRLRELLAKIQGNTWIKIRDTTGETIYASLQSLKKDRWVALRKNRNVEKIGLERVSLLSDIVYDERMLTVSLNDHKEKREKKARAFLVAVSEIKIKDLPERIKKAFKNGNRHSVQ